MITTHRIVVHYTVDASDSEKRKALLEGIRDCATELVELGFLSDAVTELEQVANDVEADDLNG